MNEQQEEHMTEEERQFAEELDQNLEWISQSRLNWLQDTIKQRQEDIQRQKRKRKKNFNNQQIQIFYNIIKQEYEIQTIKLLIYLQQIDKAEKFLHQKRHQIIIIMLWEFQSTENYQYVEAIQRIKQYSHCL